MSEQGSTRGQTREERYGRSCAVETIAKSKALHIPSLIYQGPRLSHAIWRLIPTII